jgi:hypothetical protein
MQLVTNKKAKIKLEKFTFRRAKITTTASAGRLRDPFFLFVYIGIPSTPKIEKNIPKFAALIIF